jgi:hypothetical protein
MDHKPEMSRQEYSWHKHLAGMRAADAARNQGANPATIDALASVTAGPVTIGGFTLHPATRGLQWTLQRLAREFALYAIAHNLPDDHGGEYLTSRELIELGLSTLAFADPLATWQALEAGDLKTLIRRADALAWETPVEITQELEKHFRREMDRISSLAGDDEEDTPKKPQALAEPPSGASPASPIPPPAPESPRSSGLPPNTPSLSPMPSGEHPSS